MGSLYWYRHDSDKDGLVSHRLSVFEGHLRDHLYIDFRKHFRSYYMTPFDPGTQQKAFRKPQYNYSDIYGSQKTKLLSTNEAFCMNHEKMDLPVS